MTPEHDVVAAVLVRRRRVLLVHRAPDREAFPDVWDLPGGHVERGESAAEAIARELHEELGITVEPTTVRPVTEIRLVDHAMHLQICWIPSWQGEPVNACPAEHDRIGWFTSGELPQLDLAHPMLVDLLTTNGLRALLLDLDPG